MQNSKSLIDRPSCVKSQNTQKMNSIRYLKTSFNTLRIAALGGVLFSGLHLIAQSAFATEQKPNIVYIMADDLGYGDVHSLAPETGKIRTPHADRLASEGMIFTDAHSGSSVCTPTRYGILTGRYAWRTRLQRAVVQGFAPNLIAENRPTVASFLKAQGYHTAIVGKWHLNFLYHDPKTGVAYDKKKYRWSPPVGAKIPDSPLTRGFDYFHGYHHTRSMDAIIEDDTVIMNDDAINMLPRLTKKSVAYIESRADHPNQPFFLYLPLSSPHSPVLPTPEWEGKSGLGKYGDFVMQTDHVVGEVMATLEKHGMTENTIVIFTSDNGCDPRPVNIPALAKQGHHVSGPFRGAKSNLWDGGHRTPFIVKWPGKVKAASASDQLICLTDLFATVGEITKAPLPAKSGEDSVSFLPALSGNEIVSTRNGVVHHAVLGHFAYRQGKWKLLLARGSGGWTSPTEVEMPSDSPEAQLYDVVSDPGETKNLYHEKPEIAKKLLALLEGDVARGRSTAGLESQNDLEKIVLWKSGRKKD